MSDPSLVLIGGGHAQAIALKLWGQNPLAGVNLTLISDVEQTPYSGMLPGHVAGFYSYAETHIDLRSLSQYAGANLVIDKAVGLDLANNRVILASQKTIAFDYLSIDIGSTPQTSSLPGVKEYATPAKPVPLFLAAWEELLAEINHHPAKSFSIGVVGGGAGGVELALNMQARFREMGKWGEGKVTIDLIHRGSQLLSGHNSWVSHKLKKILISRGIKLHLEQSVAKVLPEKIICESGLEIKCNRVFWVTQAAAPDWIKASGLKTDASGFILVKDTLQSISHPHIFAAGDIATMKNHQRPKAGVFAVRQGEPLFTNWRRIILGETLKSYTPQSKYLALIGTGDRQAIASWSKIGWRSQLFWYFKDYIDRNFMNQFTNLT